MKLRAAIVALFTIVALVTSVVAQPATKVLVLPLDGNTPAAQRDGINASVVKLAKSKIGGDVSVGETTFNETAAAVGCDPALASCAEQVRTTLAVDEFQGDLEGLLLAEAEFDTEERLAAFPMPDFALREVTDDPRYTGSHLVRYGLPKD